MEHVVLFVDRDQQFLLNIKEILSPYKQHYNVLISGSVQAAIKKLRANNVCVVFLEYSDFLPEHHYFLSTINSEYPEITVIVYGDINNIKEISSFNSVIIKHINIESLNPEELHKVISAALEEQRDGGSISNIELSLLLQLLEAEQKSCTLRVYNLKTKERGLLFFDKGRLVSAKTVSNKDLDAAKEIIGWEDTKILIQNKCLITHGKSIGNLRAIVLDTMREKDEFKGKKSLPAKLPMDDSVSFVAQKIDETFFYKWRPMKIYQDPQWAKLVDHLKGLGKEFGFGNLRALFLQEEGDRSYIIVPLKDTVVLDVESNCPRDKVLRAFLA